MLPTCEAAHSTTFCTVNASSALLCDLDAASSSALLHGSGGSSWTTRAARIAKKWPDVGPPENMVSLEKQARSWEVKVTLQPRSHGEQAGLYAYVDEKTWVKWVVEGARPCLAA